MYGSQKWGRVFRLPGGDGSPALQFTIEDNMRISLFGLVNKPIKYVLHAYTQDIYITKEAQGISKLTSIKPDTTKIPRSVSGILPQNADMTSIKNEYFR